MSYKDSENNVSQNRLDHFNTVSVHWDSIPKLLPPTWDFLLKKMKYNLRNRVFDRRGATQLENVGTQSEKQNPESSKDTHTGVTEELQNLSVKAPGTVLFLSDTADKLYRVQIQENCDQYKKIRYLGWGSARRLVKFQINLSVFKIQS